MTQDNLGTALQALGERENNTTRLEEARVAIRLARDVYRASAMTRYDELLEAQLASIDKLIANRT